MNLVPFYAQEDVRVWDPLNHSFDIHLSYLEPVSCLSPSWIPLGCTVRDRVGWWLDGSSVLFLMIWQATFFFFSFTFFFLFNNRVLITGPPGSLHILLFNLTYMTGKFPSNSRNDHPFTIWAFICLSADKLFLFSFRVCAWQTERAQSELEIQSCLCYWFIRNNFVRVHLWNCFSDLFYLLTERFFFFLKSQDDELK